MTISGAQKLHAVAKSLLGAKIEEPEKLSATRSANINVMHVVDAIRNVAPAQRSVMGGIRSITRSIHDMIPLK